MKYCKNKEANHWSMLIKPISIENSGVLDLIEEVDDFVLKLLFCGVGIYSETGLSAKYLDKVEELASMNFLAFIITDESLCYGTNFPISNVILRDDLVEKLNMNEMFQLIGRAGRVGQSWTARAFLE
jgi:replicative superfamily II helicase